MDYIKFAEVVRGLKEEANVSKTEMLRECYELIESALRRGVRRKAVVAGLEVCGLIMSMATFESAMHRIRKENARDSQPHNRERAEDIVTKRNTPHNASRRARDSLAPSTRRQSGDHTAAKFVLKNSLAKLLKEMK
jgi:hypothetical protein